MIDLLPETAVMSPPLLFLFLFIEIDSNCTFFIQQVELLIAFRSFWLPLPTVALPRLIRIIDTSVNVGSFIEQSLWQNNDPRIYLTLEYRSISSANDWLAFNIPYK
ncbi:hypothetical protein BDDG_06263 [Blastomyces dermatitidis ATCC 18188]|uniref:Uncharacterized protein n=1 Tax=Ajellomyces dermatitidis (strain ATCC 18188 / CBS 674.68) TaxID=653446 RepID=F2TJA6_AJEDA|nr:hypothetical protein BDDG_06263 [Blastomyces dermatitidis ATCC 18188]